MNWPDSKRIAVVVDPPGGWFDPHAERLVAQLRTQGHIVVLVNNQDDLAATDLAFFLSCQCITPVEVLARSGLNVVVHASDLPKGRGMSPLVWQILEGASDIPLTMIEMTPELDAGDILMQRHLSFEGHELNDEMREKMGARIVDMCDELARLPTRPEGQPQSGEPTRYRRRGPNDSRLDPDRSIAEQFDLLRVVDNDRYPAFVELRGRRYALRIEDISDPAEPSKEPKTP